MRVVGAVDAGCRSASSPRPHADTALGCSPGSPPALAVYFHYTRLMDVVRMQLLAAIARHGTMAGAAAEMRYTTSAVSQQVRKLERETGLPLLDRLSRGVKLTDAGAVVVRAADAVEAHLSGLREDLEALRVGKSGNVRLGVFPTFAASLLPQVLLEFRQRAPGVQVEVRSSRQGPLREMLERREIDLAVTWRYPWTTPEDDLECQVILNDRTVLVVPAGHSLARQVRLRAVDLATQDWIVRAGHPAGELVHRTLHGLGVTPRVAVEANDYQEMQAMVAAGLGIMLCAELATVPLRNDLVVRALDEGASPVREIVSTRVPGRPATVQVALMAQVLQDISASFDPAPPRQPE